MDQHLLFANTGVHLIPVSLDGVPGLTGPDGWQPYSEIADDRDVTLSVRDGGSEQQLKLRTLPARIPSEGLGFSVATCFYNGFHYGAKLRAALSQPYLGLRPSFQQHLGRKVNPDSARGAGLEQALMQVAGTAPDIQHAGTSEAAAHQPVHQLLLRRFEAFAREASAVAPGEPPEKAASITVMYAARAHLGAPKWGSV